MEATVAAIEPGRLAGTAAVPPSKSAAHRAVVCAALAAGTSHIGNVEFSQDILATLGAAQQRKRQHPALSHPARQPDRAESDLYRPWAADGAPPVVYALYQEQGLRFEQARRA